MKSDGLYVQRYDYGNESFTNMLWFPKAFPCSISLVVCFPALT